MLIVCFDDIHSTNSYSKNIITTGNVGSLPDSFVVLANNQSSGIAKYNKEWNSFAGNLHFSLNTKIDANFLSTKNIGIYSLLVGIAIRDTMLLYLKNNVNILYKWPNDIIINNAKISGTLIEVAQDRNFNNYLITGVGLNLVQAPIISNYKTISVLEIENTKINIIDFAKNLVSNIAFYVDNYLEKRSQDIINLWLNNAYGLNKNIIIKTRNMQATGLFQGLTEEGYIILNNDGTTTIFNVGDVWLL